MTSYTFGSFQLNNNANGLGYYVTGKDLSLPTVKPASFNVARRDGAVKSGEMVDPRQVPVTVKIVGTSRLDVLTRLDALQQALALRGQPLTIHDTGTRYYPSCDAVSAPLSLRAGNGIAQCECSVVFLCYDPYAYATTLSTYDTGTVVLTAANSLWNFPAITITGGGTTYSLPLIHLVNKTSTGSTTLSAGLTSGSPYTSISVAATPFSGSVGDTVLITHGTTTQTLTVATAFIVGATSITVNSFTAAVTYSSGDTAQKNTAWTALTLTQQNDSQTLSVAASTSLPLPTLNGDYLDVQCDPAQVNGWTMMLNGNGSRIEPIGQFPEMEPGVTTFGINIASGCAVSAEAVFSWLPRWLA